MLFGLTTSSPFDGVKDSVYSMPRFWSKLRFAVFVLQEISEESWDETSWVNHAAISEFWVNCAAIILLILVWFEAGHAKSQEPELQWQGVEKRDENIISHSCIHDQIIEQRKRPGRKVYSVTPQVYEESGVSKPLRGRGRVLLEVPTLPRQQEDVKQPIRIFLNYDAVGHSPDRDCRNVGEIVKLGEPPLASHSSTPSCNPHCDPPISGDCWYNCTLDDIAGEDKRRRLRKALGQTADWFRRALAVERVRGNLRLSGYSACGQDGGVQLPREYVEEGVADADLVLLVTTRPTTGNTLAWAVACERDQWGRAIAGHVNVAPRHLTAEAETLLSATLIHEVMHVLGFDPHAFAHFRDERKRRRSLVTEQAMDEKLGRMAFSENFTGLELEDGGGRGTSGSHWEKRLLMNEIMTGSVDTRSVVSKMTLALLEDSGWYQANYSMADRLDWGRNQGTEFVASPCNLWKGAYHCNTTQLSGCTYNREAEGYCPIVNYSGDLPQWARYFPQANKGGQSSLADYCTYFVAYSDGSCTDINSARSPDRMLGEVRGSNSRCMASSLVRTGFVRGSSTQGNGCYQHRIIAALLQFDLPRLLHVPSAIDTRMVAVDGIWKACPESGGPVQFPGFNGNISILLDDSAPVIVMGMENAFKMVTVNVKLGTLALTVLLISIQKCDKDGDNRLRVCHSACQSYNLACGASLDCSDQTLFSNMDEGEGLCTGRDMRNGIDNN
ncbi:hypothetical protein RJ640_021026 [Escallonia rubra]|uniref:Leishmanolysin-like peptidase n=1 Tax=Escallonia rubra TaxID=112253 RepID=A0AA88RZH7_9ASTE|nr:hypothetical protein RJ640_021026 [Escallonia rubra]